MTKALWLTSWYPNNQDAMRGDFIQRHARAVALFCRVDVIHLEPDTNNELKQSVEISKNQQGNLSETIVIYKLYKLPLIGKLFSLIKYIRLFQQQLRNYIVAYGKPDIVHVHVPMKAGILAWWLKSRYGLPYVVTEHWAIYNNNAVDAYPNRNFLFKYVTRKIIENASAFLPVSKNLGEAVQQMVASVYFTAVPNVADTKFFNNDSFKATLETDFTFVHVSTLNYQKNPEGILRAFLKISTQYPKVKLAIVGEHPEPLIAYAASIGINENNILFTGLKSYEAVAAILKQCHVLVMFSRYENLPCVIIEALCCGLPVISTDVGGIPEMINDSNGILIGKEDEDALYNAMQQLYTNFNNYNKTAIADSAENIYSYQAIGKRVTGIYDGIISKPAEKQ